MPAEVDTIVFEPGNVRQEEYFVTRENIKPYNTQAFSSGDVAVPTA